MRKVRETQKFMIDLKILSDELRTLTRVSPTSTFEIPHSASPPIPVCLWFLAKDKSGKSAPARHSPQGEVRDRRQQTLFIDARKLNRPSADLVHVCTERTDAAIQVGPGENGEAICEYTLQRDIHFKAA